MPSIRAYFSPVLHVVHEMPFLKNKMLYPLLKLSKPNTAWEMQHCQCFKFGKNVTKNSKLYPLTRLSWPLFCYAARISLISRIRTAQ